MDREDKRFWTIVAIMTALLAIAITGSVIHYNTQRKHEINCLTFNRDCDW